jgi:hypothetical protein
MMNIIGIDVTNVSTTAKFKLGTVAGDIGTNGPQKNYKYIKYNAATAAVAGVAGEVAYYYLAGGYADSEVTSDVSDSVNVGAGVLQAVMADATYGWVQIGGPATLSIALTAGADGNALTAVGAGDGTLDVSGAVTDAICAFADDISAKEIVCCFPV